MRYAQIRQYDVANGEGLRTTLFVSGCTHNCFNCFNKDYQDFNYGKQWDKEVEDKIIMQLKEPQIKGLSLLGGEPFQSADKLYELCLRVREDLPEKDIWCWTGFLYEDLYKLPYGEELLSQLDILVDGRFIQKQKDLTLKWRGSSNQRIIDVQKSLDEGKIVLYEG